MIRSVTEWVPGARPAKVASGSKPSPGALVWCELDGDSEAGEALAELTPLCPGIERAMVEALLEPDSYPEGKAFADGEIRLASTCFITAVPDSEGDGPTTGTLVIEPIEILADRTWLISCWHAPSSHHGLGNEPCDPVCDRAAAMRAVERRWVERTEATAGDLGVLLMQELALEYAPAQRKLDMWLESWELALYEQPDEMPELEAQRVALRRLWGLRAAMRDWVSPLNRPGINDDIEKAWLPASDAQLVKRTDDRIDSALDGLAAMGETLRASFSLVHMEEQEKEKDRREDTQRRVELIAAVFLIPSFIVGLYGANTWIPGESREWGFAVMLVVMAILTVGAVYFIRWLQKRA